MVVRCGDEIVRAGAGHWVSMPRCAATPSGWSVTTRRGSARARQRVVSGFDPRPRDTGHHVQRRPHSRSFRRQTGRTCRGHPRPQARWPTDERRRGRVGHGGDQVSSTMRRRRVFVVAVLVSAAAAAASEPANGVARDLSLPGATRTRVEKVVRQFKDTNQPPGRPRRRLEPEWDLRRRAPASPTSRRGRRSRPTCSSRSPARPRRSPPTWSCSSSAKGKVALDDHISKWVAGVPNGDEITIRQLLNHTSGLADGFTSPTIQGKVPTGCTVDELLTAEASSRRSRAPGTKWSYSNYGYNLLGRVVELVDRPGPEHRAPAAHRRTTRPPPDLAADIGQRPQRALHPRLRDRRRRPHPGADRRR